MSACALVFEHTQEHKHSKFWPVNIIPRISKLTTAGRSFSYLAPKLLNSLPNIVREADTICQFKSRLKTHLFGLAYT